jgi:hypothetical protein
MPIKGCSLPLPHITTINTHFLLHPQLGLNYFEEITRGTFYPESSLFNAIPRIDNRPTLNEKNNGIRGCRESGRLARTYASHEGGNGFKLCWDTEW